MKLTGMYTAAGAQLAVQAQAEETSLIITRAAAGSGQTDISASAMENEMQALELHDKTWQGQQTTVAAVMNATLASQTYLLREVGLFARVGDGPETLYKLFKLDESLTVENDTDLTVTFYLTETILQADQIQVTITQQGLVTEAICRQVAQNAAAGVQTNLEGHMADGGAHSALFAQKAPLSHTHGAGQITGGTLAGVVAAQSNTGYETAQVRNISLSTGDPTGGSNGQIWFKYTT